MIDIVYPLIQQIIGHTKFIKLLMLRNFSKRITRIGQRTNSSLFFNIFMSIKMF